MDRTTLPLGTKLVDVEVQYFVRTPNFNLRVGSTLEEAKAFRREHIEGEARIIRVDKYIYEVAE